MFETATRTKLRFNTPKGNLSAEQVWDLPLVSPVGVSLDNLAKDLNKQLKDSGEESFVVKKSKADSVLQLRFDIVKYIIKVRLEEKEAKENAVVSKQKRAKIDEIIADKEDDELKGKSVSELKKLRKKI